MNERALELARRHGQLQAKIADQRRALAQHAEPVARLLDKGDGVLRGLDWLKQHPAAVGAGVTILALLKPRGAWRWAKRSFVLWRGWQALRASLGAERL